MAGSGSAREQVRALGAATRREVAAAVAHARGLDAAGWEAPSWCDGWAVRDVLSHLTEGTERYHLQTRAALDGQAVPEFSMEERNARRGVVKAMAPEQMLGELERRSNAFWDDVEGRSEEALAGMALPHVGGRTLSGPQVCRLRLNEFMLHRWDTVAARDPGATLDAESAGLALDYNLGNAARMAKAPALEGLEATYLCQVSGPGGGPVAIVCRGGKVEVAREAPERADVTLRLPAETLNRLLWGRVDVERALADGTIQVQGDPEQARALGRVFGNR
jgi:uncharacterized protein (TIGR03083 family)